MGIYKCRICGKYFKKEQITLGCAVLHDPETCCHMGETEVQPPQPQQEKVLVSKEIVDKMTQLIIEARKQAQLEVLKQFKDNFSKLLPSSFQMSIDVENIVYKALIITKQEIEK